MNTKLITSIVFLFIGIWGFSAAHEDTPITIKVVDHNSKTPIKCVVELKDVSSDKGFFGKGMTNDKGEFDFKLVNTAVLSIKAYKSGYMPDSKTISVEKDSLSSNATITLELTKIQVGQAINLDDVKFEKGKHTLLPSSYHVLKNLVLLLEQNPKMKIELAGHTDNTGGTKTNLALSERRVASVKAYLIAKNIKSNRIKEVGYGGKKPIAKNNTEEGREKNRRVEFKVLKIE